MLSRENLDLVKYFLRAYPQRSALIVCLLILSGFSEGLGIATLLPVLELATAEGTEDSPLLATVRLLLGSVGLTPTLGVLLTLVVVGMVLKGGFLFLAGRQIGYTVAGVSKDLRLMLIRALLRARWGYFVSQKAGHISNAIGSEAHRASMAYSAACSLLATSIQVLLYVAIALLISPTIALAAVLAGGLIILLLSRMVRIAREAGRSQTILSKSLSGRMIDALHGLKPIKAMAQERQFQPILESETRDLNEAQRRQVLATNALSALHEPMLVSMLALGLYVILSAGVVEFSGLLIMAFLFHRLVGRIHLLQTHYQSLTVSESAFSSLRQSVEHAEAEAEPSGLTTRPPRLSRGIRLEDVSFRYGRKEVLRDVSLEIPAGSFVTLFGPSGAGKTTVADLIIGLFRPESGEVYIDDVPLGTFDLTAWRRMIGYVPQEMLLFHDSIRNNVSLGDVDVTDDDVQDALRAAGALEFVDQLPDGIETVIGERGAKLSGGQRQRIAIARALARKPRLLVLDEVTTALDPRTEAEICETLRLLRGEVTILAISHQPALTRVADTVFLVENHTVRRVERALPSEAGVVAAAS